LACNGVTTTLTAVGSGGVGTRQFSLNGAAFQAGTTFTVNAAGSPYIITVKDANGCLAASSAVIVAPAATTVPPVPVGIDGQAYGLCGGGSFAYSTPAVPTATSYYWTVPTTFTVSAGQGTSQAQLLIPSTFNTNNTGITVVAKNACGTSPSFRLGLYSVLSYPGSAITGPASVTPGQTNVQYSLPNTAGATYNWLVPTGATVSSGQGTSTVFVNFGSTSGNVSVDITNACGTGARVSKAVTFILSRPTTANQVVTQKPASDNVKAAVTATNLAIYPNPVQGRAIVVFDAAKAGSKFEVMITNVLGKTLLVKSGKTIAGVNMLELDMNILTNGIYILKLAEESRIETKRLVKQQ
jgi:hypothetical protein